MDWAVRDATPGDAASVREVARESWHAAYDEFLGADRVERITDEWYAVADLEGTITDAAERNDVRFLVAAPEPSTGATDTEIGGLRSRGRAPQ
ncbi:hypothetical protein [Natronorubrum sp. DTA7]|uniref:hypothetical protein n=1 Tax=Natronorubrum sp. DTA7 TaxID=3447016 RepID=UPI003F852D22